MFYLLRTFVYVNHKRDAEEVIPFSLCYLNVRGIWGEGRKGGGKLMSLVHVYFPMDGVWFVVSPLSSSSSHGALPLVHYMDTDSFDTEVRMQSLPLTPHYCCSGFTTDKYQTLLYPWVDDGLHFYPVSVCWVEGMLLPGQFLLWRGD